MSDKAIRVSNLSKIYHLYDSPKDRFKESLHPFRKKYHRDFFALREVSFTVKKGETVGVIGRNGSGKSTLLKILTGVLTPSSGTFLVNGKVSSLLELGTGFNPELTGIENVYFNGTILGFSRDEMNAKLCDILTFADIGDFVHQPVKMYSSGMYVRLAFAVAINIDPEILIVDEALSVGDVFFQQKCSSFMRKNFSDKTKLIVSHDLYSIISLCDRVIVLENGCIIFNGIPDDAVKLYTKLLHDLGANDNINDKAVNIITPTVVKDSLYELCKWQKVNPENMCGTGNVKITDVSLTNENWENVYVVSVGDTVYINIIIESNIVSDSIIAGYLVYDRVGNDVFGETSKSIPRKISFDRGSYLIRYKIDWPSIRPGFYTITPGIGEGEVVNNNTVHSWAQNCIRVENVNPLSVQSVFNHKITDMTIDKL